MFFVACPCPVFSGECILWISSSQVLFISPIKAAIIYQAMHDGECGKTVSVLITRQFESMSPGDRSHSYRSHVTSKFNSLFICTRFHFWLGSEMFRSNSYTHIATHIPKLQTSFFLQFFSHFFLRSQNEKQPKLRTECLGILCSCLSYSKELNSVCNFKIFK